MEQGGSEWRLEQGQRRVQQPERVAEQHLLPVELAELESALEARWESILKAELPSALSKLQRDREANRKF